MLRLDAQCAVFLGDPADDRKNFLQPIDMGGRRVNGVGQSRRLLTLTLIGVVKNIKQFGMVFEHHLVELFGNGLSVDFKHRNGGLDYFNRFGI
ncbi:hypothetical protein D1872_261700 [compost metagenome]